MFISNKIIWNKSNIWLHTEKESQLTGWRKTNWLFANHYWVEFGTLKEWQPDTFWIRVGWLVFCCCIPFGWKSSAYIYHSTGLLASHCLRSLGMPFSLYIDDRHSSQLSFTNGCLPVAYQNLPSQDSNNLALANAAIFLKCFILSSLG